jgi:hypothetical protein
MYIIKVDVNGFNYYLNIDGQLLQGLSDNATRFRSEYEARATLNIQRNKVKWPLSIIVVYAN